MAVRVIEVREPVMARNNEFAARVREKLDDAGVVALNLVSSPGAGKTLLLERTLELLDGELAMAVGIAVQRLLDRQRLRLFRHSSSPLNQAIGCVRS